MINNITSDYDKNLQNLLENQKTITECANRQNQTITKFMMAQYQLYILETLIRELNELTEATLAAKSNVLHPMIITPQILLKHMINLHLNKNE